MALTLIDKETAEQFALILAAGVPHLEAIAYVVDTDDPHVLKATLNAFMKSPVVTGAIERVQGGSWTKMSLPDRIKLAVEKHYTEMAYFLYRHNYAELTGADQKKADVCREALERRQAGTAGKVGILEAFYNDLAKKGQKIPDRPVPITTPVN